jgi:hypothetical protein
MIEHIERVAEDVLSPLRGETWRTAIDPPASISGAELSGTGLAFSTVKESEDGDWLVLRCVNLLDQPVRGAWFMAGLGEAMRARLDESPLEPVAVQDGRIDFVAPARAAVTILAR